MIVNESLKRGLRSATVGLNAVLRPVGLHVDLDFTYTASYLFHLENLETRLDDASGKEDADFVRRYVPQSARVLDIGCGGGRVERHLAPHVREAHGCDVALQAVKLSRRNCQGLSNAIFTHVKDGPRSVRKVYARDGFDVVFSIATLQHMPKGEAYLYLEEASRLLKVGGVALLHFPNLLSDRNLRVFQEYAHDRNRHLTRMHHYTPQEVERLVSAAGLHVDSLQDHYRFKGDLQLVASKPTQEPSG